jgi:glycerophosphoryl diester phosphodiesterase
VAQHPYLDGPHPRAFAHRGWHAGELTGMENSMAAFQRAAKEGYRYLETDVHATSDGVVVIHHDTVLDRTTDGAGAVGTQPWSVVGKALVGGREPVCRLTDVLEELPDALLNIDVKAASAVEPLVRTLHRANALDRVCIASFSHARLARVRRLGGPRLLTSMAPPAVGALWAASHAPVLPLRWAIQGAAAQIPVSRGRMTLVTPAVVRIAHRRGAEVHVWTVDEAAEMRRLLDMGVDGLVTDQPAVLRDVLQERGVWV